MLKRSHLLVDQYEIPYAEAGTGPDVLVCVNGMQQTMASWAAFIKRVGVTGYRIVIFDFPNQGRAVVRHGDVSLTPQQQIDILAAIVNRTSPDAPVALVGGSWGSLLAAGFAALYPDRVSKLLLCGFQTRPSAKVQEIARRGRALIADGRPDEVATLFLREFANRMPLPLQGALRMQFRKLRPGQLRQLADQGLMLTGHTDLDRMFDLRRITAETLVINGELDPLIDHEEVASLIGRMPGARLFVEPRAGHFLHLERPEILDLYVKFFTPHPQAMTA